MAFESFVCFGAKTDALSSLKLPFCAKIVQNAPLHSARSHPFCVYVVSFATFAFFAAKIDISKSLDLPFLRLNPSKRSSFLRVSAWDLPYAHVPAEAFA